MNMFNLFPKIKSVDEIIKDVNTTCSGFTWIPEDSAKKDAVIINLREQQEFLYKENQKLEAALKSIEEDGTEEHNKAVKLRQENAQLKIDIEGWRTGVMHWKELYDEKADAVDELMKEVKGLRHLKKENVELIERVNEIDSDMNKEYQAEIFTLKNEIAVLKNRNTELIEKYNGIITMGGLKYMEARLQIVQNDYKKCAEQRDEYKHQLNAANKEIEALKKEKKESFEILKKAIEDESARFHYLVAKSGNTEISLEKEIDSLSLTIDRKNFEIDDLKAEIKKLKDDIVDYVFDKDEEINELKKTQDWKETVETLKNMKTQGFEDYDPSDFVKTEIQIAEEEILKRELKRINDLQEETADESLEQKHPMHPLHWGGCDGAASAYPEQYSKWLNVLKEKAERLTKDVEVDLDKPLDEQCNDKTTAENLEKKFDEGKDVLDYFEEPKWKCPCNICKEGKVSWEEAASDLALKVIKLEKQIEELKIVNICQKPL
jgi:phage host-nuclease inhibitor protein Gam